MKEKIVDYITAEMAKELGFNFLTRKFYINYPENKHISTMPKPYNNNITNDRVSAPTQSLLQKWLRDEHKIDVSCVPVSNKTFKNIPIFLDDYFLGDEILAKYCCFGNYDFENNSKGYEFIFYHDTYEEALEEGLYEGLKLI